MAGATIPSGIAVGLVLSLFSPGYALLKALFPGGSNSERFGLSVPASIVLAVVVGALVNFTPFGLSTNLIVLLLWVCTVGLLAVAYVRAPGWQGARAGSTARSAPGVGPIGVIVTVLVVAASGAWATSSLVTASRTTPKPFTVLAVNGANGVQVPGEPFTVTLDNEEGQPMQYDLQVSVDGNLVSRTAE